MTGGDAGKEGTDGVGADEEEGGEASEELKELETMVAQQRKERVEFSSKLKSEQQVRSPAWLTSARAHFDLASAHSTGERENRWGMVDPGEGAARQVRRGGAVARRWTQGGWGGGGTLNRESVLCAGDETAARGC